MAIKIFFIKGRKHDEELLHSILCLQCNPINKEWMVKMVPVGFTI